MPAALGDNRYGKSGIRLVRVLRDGKRHHLADLTVDVWLEGDFEAAHLHGDNAAVLPTDTMRGTVYAFAEDGPVVPIEDFALRLTQHFVTTVPSARRAGVRIAQSPWDRVAVDGAGHPHAFVGGGGGCRTAEVVRTAEGAQVLAGVEDLVVLKTTRSGFAGFLTDEYTTLPETDDRIMATAVTATWRYTEAGLDWDACAASVRSRLLVTFAEHDSRSLQHTLFAMGEAVLAERSEIDRIHMTMPNKHHVLVDLSPYGLDNPNEVFVATDRPYGLIEGTVVRDGTVRSSAQQAADRHELAGGESLP